MEAILQDNVTEISIPKLLEDLRVKRTFLSAKRAANKIALEEFIKTRSTDMADENIIKLDICELESLIKGLAVEAYKKDPAIGKKPFAGIGIQESTKTEYQYSVAEALKWAMQKEICIRLDDKAFEAICATPAKPDFVDVSTETTVKATIATDLDKVLGGYVYETHCLQ